MKRILKHLSLLLVLIALLAACQQGSSGGDAKDDNAAKNSGKKVVATTFINTDFAKIIGGEYVDIQTIPATGSDLKNYKPSDSDIKAIQEADLVLYTGEDLEPWMTEILSDLPEGKPVVVQTAADIERLTDQDYYHSEVNDESYQSEDGSVNVKIKSSQTVSVKGGGQKDPYISTDPANAKTIASAIEKGLIQADESNADNFKKNAEALQSELDRLSTEMKTAAEQSENKRMFVADTHRLRYLANAYGLNVAVLDGETTLEDFEKEMDRVRPTTIFYIQNDSKVQAEELAAKHDAKAVQFYDYLTAPADVSILDLMEKNVESLKNGLF